MNFLFCGDHNAERGVLIAVLSLLKAERGEEVHVYILTMRAKSKSRSFKPFSQHAADFIRSLIVADNPNSSLELIDCTEKLHQGTADGQHGYPLHPLRHAPAFCRRTAADS